MQSFQDLHAISDVPDASTVMVRLRHPSFLGFLLDLMRCKALEFRIDEGTPMEL